MSNERLDGWNKQDLAFDYAKDRGIASALLNSGCRLAVGARAQAAGTSSSITRPFLSSITEIS